MAITAYLRNCLTEIKTAVYGRDVRRALHDTIEYCMGNKEDSVVRLDQVGTEQNGYVSLARFTEFVQGSYWYPTFQDDTIRVSSRNPITALDNLYIKIAEGYQALAYKITSSSTAESTGWQAESIYIPKGTQFVIMIEKLSHASSGYSADIAEHLNALKVYDDAANPWYDAMDYVDYFVTGKQINFSTGEVVSTSGYWQLFYFYRPKFKRIKALFSVYGRSTADIAFYNSLTPSTSSYMKSASANAGDWTEKHWTWADVPDGCELAIICTRDLYNDNSAHTVEIYVDNVQKYIEKKIVDIQPGLDTYSNYRLLYHYFADRLGSSNIPQNSAADIELAHRLGFKAYEINAHETATSGVYVCFHGTNNKIGNCLVSKTGEDISGLYIASVTEATFRNNYVYKTPDSKYATRPLFLDEALYLCKKYNMIPYIGWAGYDLVSYARKICGNRFILGVYDTWYLKRPNYKGLFCYYGSITAATLRETINKIGAPFAYCITNTQVRSLTDAQIKELVSICHENGCFIGYAGVYQTQLENIRLDNLGFDFMSTGWEVEPFSNGNLASIRDNGTFELFNHNGTVADESLTLMNEQYLRNQTGSQVIMQDGAWSVDINGDTMILENTGGGSYVSVGTPQFSKGMLRIRYNGTLKFSFGPHVNNVSITSDGIKEVILSSFFEKQIPNFTVTSEGTTIVYNCVFDAASC